MDRIVQRFKNFQEAEDADNAYYRSLTPTERLDILLSLVEQSQPEHEAERRLERVYRIVELEKS